MVKSRGIYGSDGRKEHKKHEKGECEDTLKRELQPGHGEA